MLIIPSYQPARLLKRYKRFLADIRLPSGEIVTVHCPNTGAMTGCVIEGSPCWFSMSDNPKRKYARTLEIVTTDTGHLAGIHSALANQLVYEALHDGVIEPLLGFERCEREVRYGQERSRIDFLLSFQAQRCYVEVKNVTLGLASGMGLFPDAISTRGAKHLRELMAMVEEGHRAVLLYCVQHTGIDRVSPADDIDPVYGQLLREAMAVGVEVLAYGAVLKPNEIRLERRLPVVLN